MKDQKQSAARLAEKKTEKLLKNKKFKVCPNKDCAARIEKISGCNHMICARCRYELCWLCDADYENIRQEGNHKHSASCPHYCPYDLTPEAWHGADFQELCAIFHYGDVEDWRGTLI